MGRAGDRRRDEDHLYVESYIRATRYNDSTAALDLALCFAYGIGTRSDWSECLAWIENAALLGSTTALMYLKRLKPDLNRLEHPIRVGNLETADVFDLLFQSYGQLLEAGIVDEARRVINLLEKTEPGRYRREHEKYCYCINHSKGTAPTATDERFKATLNRAWLSLLRESTVLREIDAELREIIHLRDEVGRNLLHYLADYIHPQHLDHGPDIVRHIGELLIESGCPVDTKDDTGDTPLSIAIKRGNFTLLDVLLGNGCEVDLHGLGCCVEQSDGGALKNLLDSCQEKQREINKPQVFSVFHLATTLPWIYTRLEYGTEAPENRLEIVEALFQYATERGFPVDEWVQGNYPLMTWCGNVDIMRYLENAPPIGSTLVEECAALAIRAGSPKTFLFLLDQGGDSRHSQWMLPLLSESVEAFERDSFYYWSLIERGADPTKMEDGGVSILQKLLSATNGAEAVTAFLTKYPEIERCTSISIISLAASIGNSNTFTAVIRARPNATVVDEDEITTLTTCALATHSERDGERQRTSDFVDIIISFVKERGNPETTAKFLGQMLVRACLLGSPRAAQKLLEAGADPNFQGGKALKSAYFHYMRFERNLDSTFRFQAPFQKRKFHALRNLLVQYGLDEEHVSKFTMDFSTG